jgi:ABC-2 type transport system ATP-binding protein
MNQSNGSKAPSSQSEILVADGLRMVYASRVALQELSFSLKAGRVLGFLGPNGAGKTTAIRILTTILEASSGRFFVDGVSSDHPQQIRRKIGVLPESLGFQKQFTAIEFLSFFGQMYGRTATQAKINGMALLKEVGLESRARSLIGTYSRGMRQRLGIARALVNDPVILFLDEPTLGLDPRGQQELLHLIQRIARERNVGVILCSHALAEIEDICHDVVILRSGKVIASGTVDDVVGRNRTDIVRVRVPTASVAEAQRILAAQPSTQKVMPIGNLPDWLEVTLDEAATRTTPDEHRTKNQMLDALLRAEIPILNFGAEGGRLQDVFLQLTEEGAQ